MTRRFAMVMPELPWPLDQGSRRFMFDAAMLLKCHGQVDLFTREIGDQAEAIRTLEAQGFHLELDGSYRDQRAGAKIGRRLGNELRAFRSSRPRELHYTATPRLSEKLATRSEQVDYAAVVGVFWQTWPIMKLAPAGHRVLLISDVEHVRAADADRIVQRRGSQKLQERLRRAEIEAWLAADWLLCISELDAERARDALRDLDGAPEIAVWPIAFGSAPIAPRATRNDAKLELLCYGHWEAPFNRDGLLWFLRELWGPVAGRFPDCSFRVAGKGLDAELRRLLAEVPSVEPLGWVESLSDELLRADAAVIPLRYAGGLRYRLLEAIAAGCPVICSDVAAAGSAFLAGEHYIPANDATQLADAMMALRGDRGRAAAVGMAERASIELETSYGRDKAANELARLIDRIGRHASDE